MFITLLLDGRYSNLRSRLRRLWTALSFCLVVTAALILILMITTEYTNNFSANRTRLFGSLFPKIYAIQFDSLWCVLNVFSTCGGLFYSKLGFNSTLASVISSGIMFTLMSYLVLLCFKFNGCNRQRAVRYRRVSSCLWTRRKVY